MGLLITIIAGAFIGWIASIIMKTNAQMGAIANIVCGIIGAFVGGFVSSFVPFVQSDGSAGFSPMQLLFGVIGACIVIGIYKAITGSGRPVAH